MNSPFPKMCRVRQNFPKPPPLDVAGALAGAFERLRPRVKSGARIAIGVGSRGIANLPEIVAGVVRLLKDAGAQPFIIPAMGSHGGATPDGQRDVLERYGVTEAAMQAPIRPSLDVCQVGTSASGVPVYCSTEVLNADGVVLVNRIKPHTDFSGALGSGLLKMSVIGLGKRTGAATMHRAASRIGYERAIREMAHVLVERVPVLGGIALLENQFQDTAKIMALLREELETDEDTLLKEARSLMPLLPFDEIDLLIIDQIGKNISGAGMDPNVIGRSVQGYSSSLMRENRPAPFIRRIFVRDLTEETHGNAAGIGLADVTTTRLVRKTDLRVTSINGLTALTPQCSKLPIQFETDREAIELLLVSLALPEGETARVVRILDTLSLTELEMSESLLGEVKSRPNLEVLGEPTAMSFDAKGNLPDMVAG